MKKFILASLIIYILASAAHAQENFSKSVGIYAGMKAGINGVEPPEGRKSALSFNGLPDFGITSYLPVSSSAQLAAIVDLGYSSYSFITKNAWGDLPDMEFVHNFSYLTLSPKFYFHSFMFGFKFGVPLAADIEGADVDTDQIDMMAEVVLGGMFPLYYDETGRFDIYIEASYMLTGLYDNFAKDDPLRNKIPEASFDPITNDSNPRVASLTIGFNYMFNF